MTEQTPVPTTAIEPKRKPAATWILGGIALFLLGRVVIDAAQQSHTDALAIIALVAEVAGLYMAVVGAWRLARRIDRP